MAKANAAATRSIVSLLKSGDVTTTVGHMGNPFVVGIGQSMGGCLLIVTQAAHQAFDALACWATAHRTPFCPVPKEA